jgi:glucan endo-1,3-alpha-glucosidase
MRVIQSPLTRRTGQLLPFFGRRKGEGGGLLPPSTIHHPSSNLLKPALAAYLVCLVCPAHAASPHYVFAHYMVAFATYGESVQAYQREIQEAQAAGIDGFALNVGAWDNVQLYYKNRVALIYNAAEQLGSGFKLFFSVDFEDPTNIVNMVESYANRTNTFRYQGRVVLSSYGHNDVPSKAWTGMDWTNAIIGKLNQDGFPIFFVPYFFSDPVQELPYYSNAVQILTKYAGILDGLFYWGAAGLPPQLAQCNSNYVAAAHAAGKLAMASVAPHYWGCVQYSIGRRYFEFDGGEGIAHQWTAIITNQPDWVEINTWNDFNESTYLSPVDNPGKYFSALASPVHYTHAGYLNVSRRYIEWFKTGQQPPIRADSLYYFYRTHPKNAVAPTNDPPVTWWVGTCQDNLYATLFLSAPAQLQINSGPTITTNSLPAGMSQVRTPFSPGAQKLTLWRGSNQVFSAQGPDIQTNIQLYDFFPATGSASEPLPPSNFSVKPN